MGKLPTNWDPEDFLTRVRAGQISRREFLATLGALGISMTAFGSLLAACTGSGSTAATATGSGGAGRKIPVLRVGLGPWQDHIPYKMIINKGWDQEVGIVVQPIETQFFGDVTQAIAGGSLDIGANEAAGIIPVLSHFPEMAIFHPWVLFDNAYDFQGRPGIGLKSFDQLKQELGDQTKAQKAAIQQLNGRVCLGTKNTDIDMAYYVACKTAGIDYKSLNLLDFQPNEGLVAMLAGHGDVFVGGIPHRTRLVHEGYVDIVTGPNIGTGQASLIGTACRSDFADKNMELLLKFHYLVNRVNAYTDKNTKEVAAFVVAELNLKTGANMTVDDFTLLWNNWEHFPSNGPGWRDMTLVAGKPDYWKDRWDLCNEFYVYKGLIDKPVDPANHILWDRAISEYIKMFGEGTPAI